MNSLYRSLAMLGMAAVSFPAFAGFTATSGVDTVLTPAGSNPGPDVGDTFATQTSGTFTSFIGDTPADPQITGGDTNFYRYTLNGTVASFDGLTTVGYSGTYRIFYDQDLNGLYGGADPSVSSGNFNITAVFTGLGAATLTGTLNQTAGPSNVAFRDLSYGGNPVIYAGTYLETVPGQLGTITGTLRQNAVVPEPASLGLLAAGSALLLRRRK